MLSVLSILAVIFLLAFLTESLVEYLFGAVIDHVPALQPYNWTLMYVAAAVGVAGAFIYQFDLIHLLGDFVEAPIPVHWFGVLLTGLAIGRGAQYLHDLVEKYFIKPK
jgi:hypothetical protein